MRPKNVTKENRRFIQGAMIINAPAAFNESWRRWHKKNLY